MGRARRLVSAVRRVEQAPYDFTADRRLPRLSASLVVGSVSGAVSAAVGTAPGTGTVTLESWDGTNLSDTAQTVGVANFTSQAMGVGSYVGLFQWSGRSWVLPGAPAMALCQLSSSLAAASGSWPSITPTSATGVTLYTPAGSGGVGGIGTATVYNFRNVVWAASKTTLLASSGGIWFVVDQDC